MNASPTSVNLKEKQVLDLSNSISGIKGRVSAGQRIYSIKSDLVGAFNGENILAAVSVAHALGVEKSNIETGVQNCPPIPGRMESYFLASGATAIVDYAHTPDAYEKVLGTLNEMSGNNGRLYVVFGAGGDRCFGFFWCYWCLRELYFRFPTEALF